MMISSEKKLCENCFSPISSDHCENCGFSAENYSPDATVLAVGSMLQNRYRIGGIIGKGGFGITYIAFDTKLERRIAVKEYFPYGLALRNTQDTSVMTVGDADVFKRGAEKFYDEARLIAKFNSSGNIVNVYDVFYENDTVYYTMEYLMGQTLKSYIENGSILTPGQAVYIAKEITEALSITHQMNVLHRDISPDNIMLCSNNKVKLIDFGAARQVVSESSHSLSVILTQGFAPFEQYQKKGKQGPWTDIYSLGASLYYGLTGKIIDDPMSRLDDDSEFQSNPCSIDSELWNVIKKSAAIKIGDRYQNAAELEEALAALSVSPEKILISDKAAKIKVSSGITVHTGISRSQPTGNSTPDTSQMQTEPVSRSSQMKTMPVSQSSQMKTMPVSQSSQMRTMPVNEAHQLQTGNYENNDESKKKSRIPVIAGIFSGLVLLVTIIAVAVNSVSDDDIAAENSETGSITASVSDTEEKTATEEITTTNVNSVIYDSKEELYPDETNSAEEKDAESAVTVSKESELPVTVPKETEPPATKPRETEPPATKPRETEPPATKPKETEPPVTKPKETEPPTPAVPDSITIGGKSYNTNMTGTLNLEKKGLKDKDIADLRYMTNLSEIILSDNSLTDLSALSGLTQLEKLTYHNNNVKDLSYAKNLKKLKVLGAENNGITDLSPLSGMTELTEIWLQNNNISDMSPLKKCTNANSLSLSGNPIKDCSAASGMKKIRNLHLYGCGLESLEPFRGCTKLEYVYIGNNEITDLTPLCGNNGLVDLYANDNKLKGNYNALKGLTILNWLDISGNGFSDPDEVYEVMCYDIYTDDDGFTYVF